MSDFANMTTEELGASMQTEIYRFMMDECPADDRTKHAELLIAYFHDTARHVEFVAHEPTDEQRAAGGRPWTDCVPKTAYGWIKMLESLDAEPTPAR